MNLREQEIAEKMATAFALTGETCYVRRERRIFAEVPREQATAAVAFARDQLGFCELCTITGLDCGEAFQIIYHLATDQGIVLNIKTNAPKTDAVFDTITHLFEGGTLYELEIANLLGVQINGIPTDIRYPLPDGWPEGQYPLRKDWSKTGSDIHLEGECP
jgi:membrane-bound hydrogenase subunit beta